jgi:C-terminal processing protease CtpA/Prc
MPLIRSAFALFVCAVAAPLLAQTPARTSAEFGAALAFEAPPQNGRPSGWGGGPPETIALDRETYLSGEAAAKIERGAGRGDAFSALTASIPIDFAGEKIELVGYLRLADVVGAAGLWMRVDGSGGMLAFDNMQQRQLDGTRDWAEYRIELPLARGARQLVFGALLSGQGTAWVDDLRILVDGVPLADVPRIVTVLERDREFVSGSGITIDELDANQVSNLAVLARVWGFLKYHHPRVAKGELHWDFELFRVLPAVLAASSAAERNDVLLAWAQRVGEPTPCDPCASTPSEPALAADLGWIDDARMLGGALSSYLRAVHRNRYAGGEHFYIELGTGAQNAIFSHDPTYDASVATDAGYRVLALFRYWNMVEYWFPYRDITGKPWQQVLDDYLPVLVAARTPGEYNTALAKLIVEIEDTHATLATRTNPLPPYGDCLAPVALRFVADRPTVADYRHATKGPASGLEIGDVVVAVDGEPVGRLVEEWLPYYPGSNRPAKLGRMARWFLRGACAPAELTVMRGSSRIDVRTERIPLAEIDQRILSTHDRPGETFQWLADDVAYLKLSTIRQADIPAYLDSLQRARGLVVDIRNYPGEFVVFTLSGHFVREPTEFARFTAPDLQNPGSFVMGMPLSLQPLEPHFGGPIAVLVDEATISQAEYTAMALRAAPQAFVVGSTTQGADGNVSTLPLPGGLSSTFSGLGVFYPDGSPTQRIGIVPDVVVEPTVEGIRDGRDEVLERALREISARAAPRQPSAQ